MRPGVSSPSIAHGREARFVAARHAKEVIASAAPFNVVADPEGIAAVALTTRATDAVIAWSGGYSSTSPRLGLARITP